VEQPLYVWVFAPGQSAPQLCGLLQPRDNGSVRFSYGRHYASRPDACSLSPDYPLDAALRGQWLEPLPGEQLPPIFDDLAPGRWGELVLRKRLGRPPLALESLLAVGDARLGALGFSANRDQPPASGIGDVLPLADLPRLAEAVARIESGDTIADEYRYALMHGPSVGGRRPKADFVDENGQLWVAKFTSAMDVIADQPRLEAFGLAMAQACGIEVPRFEQRLIGGRPVLLLQRFDRRADGSRDHVISARSLLGIQEASLDLDGSYPAIAERLRRSGMPAEAAAQWFDRMLFNIAIGNTDDHPLNHLFGWNGRWLSLMPAFDLEPCGGRDERRHPMRIHGMSHIGSFDNALAAAAEFGLSRKQSQARVEHIRSTVARDWRAVAASQSCSDSAMDQIRAGLVL
jgi:serine/threonine-protein kinase HipA